MTPALISSIYILGCIFTFVFCAIMNRKVFGKTSKPPKMELTESYFFVVLSWFGICLVILVTVLYKFINSEDKINIKNWFMGE